MVKYLCVLAIALSALFAADHAAAQERPVQVQGRVTWIAGQDLVVAPDGNPSIKVDLSQVPQEQHATLREGDRIVVTGAVNNQRSRIVALSVERLGP